MRAGGFSLRAAHGRRRAGERDGGTAGRDTKWAREVGRLRGAGIVRASVDGVVRGVVNMAYLRAMGSKVAPRRGAILTIVKVARAGSACAPAERSPSRPAWWAHQKSIFYFLSINKIIYIYIQKTSEQPKAQRAQAQRNGPPKHPPTRICPIYNCIHNAAHVPYNIAAAHGRHCSPRSPTQCHASTPTAISTKPA